MDTQQSQQVKEIYEAVAECEPARRAALLEQLCGNDKTVRAEVEALLDWLPQSENFIEQPPLFDQALLNTVAQTLPAGRRLGPYEVLRELGRGGMGVVYLAVRADDAYRKQVAIKLVWPGYDGAEVVRRFQQERQILAQLDHPHITRLLDGGTTEEGWPYVVMEYVDGQPLNQYCDARKLSVKNRLALFQQVCAAVAYAHRHLVVHRDLKPSNILVTEAGAVKLLDFGIAKLLDPALRPDALSLTITGLHAMTPEYASPEQVRGGEITTASDVYSLGVVLYELLTGQQPYRFHPRALHEVLRVIAEEDPSRPSHVCSTGFSRKDSLATLPAEAGATNTFIISAAESTPAKLRQRLSGDLDKIVLKALRKEPEQRYASVEQLSADIARHLAGEPVIARKPTVAYRAGKFIRRHPTGVAVTLTLLLALLAALVYAVHQTRQAREQARQQRRAYYATRVRQAYADWFDNNPRSYDEILQTPPVQPQPGEEDLRGLEWRYLWRLGHRERLTIENTDSCDLLPGELGGYLVTWNNNSHRYTLRDPRTGQPIVEYQLPPGTTHFHLFAAMGKLILLYLADGHTIMAMDLPSGIQRPLVSEASLLTCVTVNDETGLETGHANGQVKSWERQTGQLRETLFVAAGPLREIYQTRDRERIVTLTTDEVMQLWDVPRKQELLRLDGVVGTKANAGINNWLTVHFNNNSVAVYDIRSARKLSALDSSHNPIIFAGGNAPYLLVIGHQDNTVGFYALPTLRPLQRFVGHTGWVNSAHLSANGKWLATASSDRTIKLWDIAQQRELATLRGHHDDVVSVFWFDQDRQLASASRDHVVKTWDVAEVLCPDVLTGHTGRVFSVAFAPDSRTLASASEDRTIKLWDVTTGALLKTLRGHTGKILCVNFSPDGQRLVSSGEGQAARVWDVATGKLLFELCCHHYQMHFAAFSPDGKLIATASDDHTVKLWDATNGHEVRILTGHEHDVWSLAFSPDSHVLASGTDKGEVRLWDVTSGEPLAVFQAHGDASVWSITFTPDGQYFATASGDNTARLWRTATRQLVRTFKGHADGLFELAFSPDGQRLATASEDKTVRFWNVETGEELLILKGHTEQVWSVAFAPDCNTLASGSWDKTVRLWRAATEPTDQAKLPSPNSAKK